VGGHVRDPAPPPVTAVVVTVVVVTWQGRHLLGACLDSLRRQTVPHRVLVVDNASTDGSAELLAGGYPEVRVLRSPRNTGFAGGVALALDAVDTPYVALLNNDATADPGWLAALLDEADRHPEAAAITSRMVLDSDPDTVNNAGVVLLRTGYGADRGLGRPAADFAEPAEVFGFSGGAALLRTDALRAVGGFPARFFLYYEDTDVSWRLRLAGWTVRYAPAARVRHQHSATVDQRSAMFAFFNERNRLLTLTRCAPVRVAAGAAGRFVLATGSLAVRRLAGQAVPDVPTFRSGVRLRALGSWLRLLPWALAGRRRIARVTTADPADVLATWRGRTV
jgi:GT2 family glycosyltransferase